VASGVYFARLRCGDGVQTRKMLLLKEEAAMRKFLVLLMLAMLGVALRADPPEWSFYTEPQVIMGSYYNYMPGGFYNSPVHVRRSVSETGVYMTFHATETEGGTRRQNWAYFDSPHGGPYQGYVSYTDAAEGYGDTALDFETLDPLYAWHSDYDADDTYEVMMNYDIWHLLYAPGLLTSPFPVIPNGDWTGTGYTPPFADDEFLWPSVYVIESPTYGTDGSRRVYVFARNRTTHTDGPSQNLLYAWADFTADDLEIESNGLADLVWNYATIPVMDAWNAGETWFMPQYGVAVSGDGKLAVIGYLRGDGISSQEDPDLFVLYNDNYGEGDWSYYTANSEQSIPTLWDPPHWTWVNYDGLFFGPQYSNHINAAFDNDGNLHVPLAYAEQTYVNGDTLSYYDWLFYLRDVSFNPYEDSFSITNLWPQGEGPADEAFLPWDFNYDGEMDTDENHEYVTTLGWPFGCLSPEYAFNENTLKLCATEYGPWLAAAWIDGYKYRKACEGDPTWASWEEATELCVAIYDSDWATWLEPIRLNAVETPELAGMTPRYVYPAIEALDQNNARIHLMFMDSLDGSQITRNPSPLYYASIDVQIYHGVDKPETETGHALSLANHPNPFNPVTTLAYSLPQAGATELAVYNGRGQLVKTLVNEPQTAGDHTALWSGKDDAGRAVASGVYFARLRCGDGVQTRKMLLLK